MKRILSLLLAVCVILCLAPVAHAAQVPTQQEAFDRMVALEAEYPSGTPWTNGTKYTSETLGGPAGGCMAWAYMLSDAAFGDLPGKWIEAPITIDMLRVGDIVRINNNGHSIIVLEVHEDYIVTSEGNCSGKVDWYRTHSAETIAKADYMITRYPDTIEYEPPTVLGFTDVAGHWGEDYIVYCVENGLMQGVSDTRFDPYGTATRAQIVTVLWRQAGFPEVSGTVPFVDLTADWYAAPVAWAYENGIVNGIDDTHFCPDSPVTRQQLAAILYRYYAEFLGNTPESYADLAVFPDHQNVHDYAVEPLSWANACGIINGEANKGGKIMLRPQGKADRAQIATMLTRFVQYLEAEAEI